MAPLIPPNLATAARQLVGTVVRRASDALLDNNSHDDNNKPSPRSLLISVPAPLPLSLLSPTTTGSDADPPTRALAARQFAATTSTVPGGYHTAGPEPGAVVGITLGSLAGFLLVLWLVYVCINMGNAPRAVTDATSSYGGTASVVEVRKSSRHRHASAAAARRGGGGMGRPPPPPHVERVVVEESTRTARARRMSAGSSLPERGIPVPGPRIVPMDSDDSADEEDEVVVIEERSPPPRRRSRRGSGMTGERIYYEQRERSVSRRR
ncbi:hypothetical protein GGTG_08480 [Gaeumannomyces tritici R3-111a-1]|uniref:Uncharacterized protein n=1 Tax=Gaeumannomyces tritici (strain R3-111a-1) TaxID=644352 RepID=J3P4P3_GAET3|nr:hypothetical protein GGTG_08480 [Gaeumannomyces tritici R3-111a-1]EJT74640.1 hypothetical protein GGTG_08480 [Gaeumannomyces tritici R3-111a-1]